MSVVQAEMADWDYDPKKDLYRNRWQQKVVIAKAEFFKIPLGTRVAGADEVNQALNNIVNRRTELQRERQNGQSDQQA